MLAFFWLWAIFLWPLLHGEFSTDMPVYVLFLITSVAMRVTANPRLHGLMAVFNWLLLIALVTLFAMLLVS